MEKAAETRILEGIFLCKHNFNANRPPRTLRSRGSPVSPAEKGQLRQKGRSPGERNSNEME